MHWQPISLLFKNDPDPESAYYAASVVTHRMLRVMEAARENASSTDEGNRCVFKLYWEFASRIHHDHDHAVDIADVLTTVGLDESLAAAADDESWDSVIRTKMDDGLALVGDDVGTPIIATTNSDGQRVGYFGPVITKIPDAADSAKLWDALMDMMDIDGFYELKKTRAEMPDPGARPEPI